MDMRSQLRDFLAQNQQVAREKERFGDFQYHVTVIQPSEQDLASVQELILKFSDNPIENIDKMLEIAQILQYIPLDFINQLSKNSTFFVTLSNLISNPQYAHKAFRLISEAISPISNFSSSFFQYINCDISLLTDNYNKGRLLPVKNYRRKLPFLEIIEFLMSNLPCYAQDIIIAIEECISRILSIQSDEMLKYFKNWGISLAITKRLSKDVNNISIFHKGIKLLLQIADKKSINSYSIINFAQELVIHETFPEDITIDSLALLSKIIDSVLCGITQAQASDSLTSRLIYLLSEGSQGAKSETVNLILQLSRGSYIPMNMLIQKGLYQLLIKFAKDYPDNADQVLVVAYSICTYSPVYVESICESGFIDLLYTAIDSDSINVQRSAIYLASNIMYKGTFQEIRKIIDPRIFSCMIEFLEEDCIGIECVLDGIINGLDSEAEALDDSLKKALSTQEFVSLLQKFSESENPEISQPAAILQQKLFSS